MLILRYDKQSEPMGTFTILFQLNSLNPTYKQYRFQLKFVRCATSQSKYHFLTDTQRFPSSANAYRNRKKG